MDKLHVGIGELTLLDRNIDHLFSVVVDVVAMTWGQSYP